MKRIRAIWPIAIYPAAFALSMVLHTWGQAEINVMESIRPALVAVAISLLITTILSLLAGDRRLGGIAASACVVGLVIDRPDASLVLFVVAILVVVIARLPRQGEIRFVGVAVRAMQLVAVIALVVTMRSVVGRPGFVPVVQEAFLAPPGPADRPAAPAGAPDVFVYLLDGYPGRTASAQAPWFDPTAFPAALADRGFVVHDDARSNYPLTRLVLPSMFEGRHIGDIPALAAPFGPDQAVDARRLRTVLEHSSGLAAIRAAGYDVVWVSSGWSHIDIRNVDRRIEAPGPSELEVAILRSSGLGSILELLDPHGFSRVMRERTHHAYATAASLAKEPHDRPRFVFVHVPMPHPPTVFGADGSPVDDSPDAAWDTFKSGEETEELRRERVFAQVEAIGDMTLAGVDELLAGATTPPVVVLFSDHGTDVSFDPNDAVHSDLDERSSSFLASLSPGDDRLLATPTTPINIIGAITNMYMGTDVPGQADLTYTYDGSVLDLIPVDTIPGD